MASQLHPVSVRGRRPEEPGKEDLTVAADARGVEIPDERGAEAGVACSRESGAAADEVCGEGARVDEEWKLATPRAGCAHVWEGGLQRE
jgi:hypothetical protein